MIETAIRELIEKAKVDGVERWIEIRNAPEEIWLPQGQWEISAETVSRLPLTGKALFKVSITNGSMKKDIHISGELHAKAFIYRAVYDIPGHQSLKPEDFSAEKVELRGQEYIGKLPERIRSTTRIRKGEILLEKQFEMAPLVNKDSTVTVLIRNTDFEIKLTGIARTDGWLDQKIIIMNPVSKKSFTGRVIGIDTVEVIAK
jgi:flagella basal body P-ring formation protein FlgA